MAFVPVPQPRSRALPGVRASAPSMSSRSSGGGTPESQGVKPSRYMARKMKLTCEPSLARRCDRRVERTGAIARRTFEQATPVASRDRREGLRSSIARSGRESEPSSTELEAGRGAELWLGSEPREPMSQPVENDPEQISRVFNDQTPPATDERRTNDPRDQAGQ